MLQRTAGKIGIGLFLAVIFGLTAANLILPDRDFSENENRPLEKNPPFSFTSLFSGQYTKKFESYTTDQFPARDNWVALKTNADMALQKKDSNAVYFAKDGYLIEQQTAHTLDTVQLQTNVDYVKKFTETAVQALGMEHVRVLISPTASEVLSDLLPPYAPRVNQTAMLAQMREQLPSGTMPDLLPVFMNAAERPLFYHTDHHWTTHAAYLAYREWATSMGLVPWEENAFTIKPVTDQFFGTIYSKANYAGIQPDTIEVYEPKEAVTYALDMDFGKKTSNSLYNFDYLQKKDKYALFLDGNNALVSIKTGEKNGKKLLIIKDSYAHCFVPFAVNHFEQVDVLDLRYYHKPISEYMEENMMTDVLVLYNFVTFSKETNLGAMR